MDTSFLTLKFFLVAIPAVVILGIGKGGFAGIGMVSLPLMTLALPPLQAASIMLPILMIQDAFSVWLYRRSWDRRCVAVLLPGAAAGVLMGYLLAAEVSADAVKLTLGIISLVFGVRQLFLLFGRSTVPAWRPGTLVGILCGAAAGFTSMIAHAGAPPFQLYAIPQRLTRDVFVGTSVVFFFAVNWLKILPYAALGQLNGGNMLAAATLVPVAVASTWLGLYLVRRVDGPVFYALIYASMVLLGANLVFQSL